LVAEQWDNMDGSTSDAVSGHSKTAARVGELKGIPDFDPRGASRSVTDELRRNLLRAIEKGEYALPGVTAMEDPPSSRINESMLLSRPNFHSSRPAWPGQKKPEFRKPLNIPIRRCRRGGLRNPMMLFFKPICRGLRERIGAKATNTPTGWDAGKNFAVVEKTRNADGHMADNLGDNDPIPRPAGAIFPTELTIH